MRRNSALSLSLMGLIFSVTSTSLRASNIVNQTYSGSFPATISGTLPNQGTALEEMFTIGATSDLTAFTTSYASGGFEPTLNLYNAAGGMIAASVTPGTSPVAKPDTSISPPEAFDAYLTASDLMAGNYTLTLTDWELNQSITATNLSDGFTQNYGNGVSFVDSMGNVRTGNYAITVNLTAPTVTPEPATFFLAAPVLVALLLFARKRRITDKTLV